MRGMRVKGYLRGKHRACQQESSGKLAVVCDCLRLFAVVNDGKKEPTATYAHAASLPNNRKRSRSEPSATANNRKLLPCLLLRVIPVVKPLLRRLPAAMPGCGRGRR